MTGITGALAALSEYFTAKQTAQDDCGLDLGWSHPNATVTAKSIDNTAECNGNLMFCTEFDLSKVILNQTSRQH